jgi:hypothetical protein
VVYALPEAFRTLVLKIAHNMLIDVPQFMYEGADVIIYRHTIVEFYFKVSRTPITI